MENKRTLSDMLLEHVKKIVYKILQNEKLLQSEWRLGKVESVISTTRIKVFIDGSVTAVTCPSNPDVTFQVGDEIWVIYPNMDSNSKFALCKRGI